MAVIDNFSRDPENDDAAEGGNEEPPSRQAFVTYIRPVAFGEDDMGYAVCSEDGIQLAVFSSYDAAYFCSRQNNLMPMNVH